MNRSAASKMLRDRMASRDKARFEFVPGPDTVPTGETVDDFLARGGKVKKLAPGACDNGPAKRKKVAH